MKFGRVMCFPKGPNALFWLHTTVSGAVGQSGRAPILGSEFQKTSKRVSSLGEIGGGNGFGGEERHEEGRKRRRGGNCSPPSLQKYRNLKTMVNFPGTTVWVPSLHGAECQGICVKNENTEEDISPLSEGHMVPEHLSY